MTKQKMEHQDIVLQEKIKTTKRLNLQITEKCQTTLPHWQQSNLLRN
jgi:hypothetical protein